MNAGPRVTCRSNSCWRRSVVSGRVALEIWAAGNGTTPIQTVGPGKLLGWTPILTQQPMTAQATVTVTVTVAADVPQWVAVR